MALPNDSDLLSSGLNTVEANISLPQHFWKFFQGSKLNVASVFVLVVSDLFQHLFLQSVKRVMELGLRVGILGSFSVDLVPKLS